MATLASPHSLRPRAVRGCGEANEGILAIHRDYAIITAVWQVSSALPPAMKLIVPNDTPCILENTTKFDHYWLCIHHMH